MAVLVPPPTVPAGRTKRKRSVWLVALLSVVCVAAILVAVWLPIHLRFREQMRAVAMVEHLGGKIQYALDAPGWLSRLRADDVIGWTKIEPLGPNWLRKLLPVENVISYFLVVDEVSFNNGEFDAFLRLIVEGEYQEPHPIAPTDQDLILIAKFRKVRRLDLRRAPISDAGLKHLKDLRNLQTLNVSFSQITDESLDIIAGFENLTTLHLDGVIVTDAGVAKLANLAFLKELNVSWTRVTNEGVEPFRARPGLLVTVDAPFPDRMLPFR